MAKLLILKNNGAVSVSIDDLGVLIPASDQIDITSLVDAERFAVFASSDLRTKASTGDIVVNNGTSDILYADLETFLEQFCVLGHKLADDHIGDLPETRITNGSILARVADNETITGAWTFSGGITLQAGTALPGTVPAAGGVFYKTDTSDLYVSNGTVWVQYAEIGDVTSHTHDGTDSAQIDHADLTGVTANQHHNQIHDIDGADHTGTLSESKIANGAILARVADNETITGVYDFSSGGLIMQTGTTLPTGTIAEGRLFWKTDTEQLYVGDGATWIEFLKSSLFTAHTHNGVNSPTISHTNLTDKGTNTHAQIDSHIAATTDPHGSVMTVTGKVVTPVLENSGDITVDAKSADNTTIFLKNSGGGGFNVRIQGQLDVDGDVNSTLTQDLLVQDNKVVLNSSYAGSSPSIDASLEVERGTAANAQWLWNEASDAWQGGIAGNLNTVAYIDKAETISGAKTFTGAVVIEKGTELPASATDGRIFWKTDTDTFYVGDGSAWLALQGAAAFASHDHDGVNSPVISHNDLADVTPDQHHSQAHAFDSADHTGTLSESKIADGAILARVASNETITGAWAFTGDTTMPQGASLPSGSIGDGRVFWKSDTDELYVGDGAAWALVAKKGGILGVTAGTAIGVTAGQTPTISARYDNATIVVNGSNQLAVGTIAESQITDGSILARVASNEVITGNWEFNGNLTIPTIPGTTLPAGTIPNGRLIQLEGNDKVYIGNGADWTQVITTTDLSLTVKCRMSFSRGGSIPAGTFLKNGDVVMSATMGAPMATESILAGAALLNNGDISDSSTGIEIFKNGSSVATLNVDINSNKGYTSSLNVSFAAGDVVSIRAKTSNPSNLSSPQVTLEFK